MYWHESQQPGKIDISFPGFQANTLRSACEERTAVRESQGNSPLAFDESIVEIVNESVGMPTVELTVDSAGFHELPQLILEFAGRTKELTLPPDPPQNPRMNILERGSRAAQGLVAANILLELEGAVAAYDSGFHAKLDEFLRTLNAGE